MDRFNGTYGWVNLLAVPSVTVLFSVEMIMRGEAAVEGVPLELKIHNWLNGLDSAVYMVASALVDYSVSHAVFV